MGFYTVSSGEHYPLGIYSVEDIEDHLKNFPHINEFIKIFKENFLDKFPNQLDLLYRFNFHKKVTRKKYKEISKPTPEGLTLLANYYKNKYEISIHVVNINELPNFLEELKRINSTQNFGIIVQEDGASHVTPLLCSFEGEKTHFLIADSIGKEGQLVEGKTLVEKIQNKLTHFPESKIFISKKVRQADSSGCATDAIVILRNALLSLKRRNLTDFSSLITFDDSYEIKELPLEWDYCSQISNRSGIPEKTFAVRDLFSKQLVKKEDPRTVGEFRRKYTEQETFEYQFKISTKRYDDPSISLENLFAETPSLEGVSIKKWSLKVQWAVSKSINTYLIQKGFNLARK